MGSIPSGDKYAILALPARHVTVQFSDPPFLGDDIHATGHLPFALPNHWNTWLGSLRVDDLKKANLFLFNHVRSSTSAVLDQENKDLMDKLHRLYFGLLIAAPYLAHEEGMLLTGVCQHGTVDVRQVQNYEAVFSPAGCHGAVIDDALLKAAKAVSEGVFQLEGANEHSRVWRIIDSFYTALQANEFGVRLHQFVRCVEGFVLPEAGSTKKHMMSRGKLFVGVGYEHEIGVLFDVRSSVEHLHGPYPVVPGQNRRDRTLNLAELTHKSEALAKYCLRRLFTRSTLWPHFKDDVALRSFWSLDAGQRAALWGPPINIVSAFGQFSRKTAAIQLGV